MLRWLPSSVRCLVSSTARPHLAALRSLAPLASRGPRPAQPPLPLPRWIVMSVAVVALTVLAGCASIVRCAPGVATRTLRFESAADLDDWVAHGGDWTVSDGHAVGRSLSPQSDRYSWLTCRTSYAEIQRVIVHGSLDGSSPHNLRLGVGAVTVILNWEVSDANLVHYVGSDGHGAGRRALTPGRESEIVVECVGSGPDRHVRLVVDDRLLWEGEGPPLTGTVTVYPALGSTIRVRDVQITGRPAPCVEVQGPSLPHY